MDYYDDNPLKVNKQINLLTHIKKMRKAERKARKELKAIRMAELLIEQEKQRELEIKFQSIETEKFKPRAIIEVRDTFNWDELEDELNSENLDFEEN